jgi:hypothetical protein
MKRITIAAVAAALLATIAFAESAADRPSEPVKNEKEQDRYLPSVNFMTDGFSGGAFTLPPS